LAKRVSPSNIMERKFLITSIFITLGAIAFLSGYLLMPEGGQEQQAHLTFSSENLDGRTGLLTNRFRNKVEINVPESKAPNTLPLSSREFISFVQPFSDSKKIVAMTIKGEIVEIDMAYLIEKVIPAHQVDIMETVFSPAGNAVIFSFYSTVNDKKWVYHNLKTGGSSEIAGDLKSAAFSPDGIQAVYLINNEDGGELLVAKDGKIIKRALKTRLGATLVTWPLDDFISIVSYDKSGYGDLFTLKKDGGFNKVLSYQYDLNAKWSPTDEKIIFSAKNDMGPTQLFYKDIKNSGAVTILDANTNVSKCVWVDKENVICGITDKTQIRDEFYKINLTDGSKILIATPDINLLVKELSLSRSGDALFVLNDIDDKLYTLELAVRY